MGNTFYHWSTILIIFEPTKKHHSMKKVFISVLFVVSFFSIAQQSRGIRIGYIDMEYILEHVPDYTEAKNQLEQKAQKWKQDIEAKKTDIAKLKDALKTERPLLTKELIDEREEEILFQETELLDFQQKKFGPNGDLITQKAVLVKPIQDQVFTAVQEIAEIKKYDFVFDKSSDLTLLFTAKRHDISDQVVRVITRAEKREQKSKKEIKEQEKKEYQEDLEDANSPQAERKKILEEKKKAREKLIEDRKLAAEEKKKEQEAKRKELADARAAKKSGTIPANEKTETNKTSESDSEIANKTTDSTSTKTTVQDKSAERARILAEKKAAIEEKKRRAIEAREALKKAREEQKATQKP
jgi:Skp family chaperone for outer membrane proteins